MEIRSVPFRLVYFCYHCLSSLSCEVVVFDVQRNPFTTDIETRSEHEQTIEVLTPTIDSDFILQVTLVQEGVFWFDELDPPVKDESHVSVGSKLRSSVSPRFSLEHAASWHNLRMIRDGIFSNLGFVNDAFPESLTFVESEFFAAQTKENPDISCVITLPKLAASFSDRFGIALSDAPRRAFAELHNHLVS